MDVLGIIVIYGIVAPLAALAGGVWRTLKWLLGRR